MNELQDLLSSISDEDMKKITNIARSIMSDNSKSESDEKPKNQSNPLPFDDNTVNKILSVMGKINKEDNRTRLISDLKPLLSAERQKKADDAIKFLQMIDMLPLLRGMFGNE